jgi:hypothetical protein
MFCILAALLDLPMLRLGKNKLVAALLDQPEITLHICLAVRRAGI